MDRDIGNNIRNSSAWNNTECSLLVSATRLKQIQFSCFVTAANQAERGITFPSSSCSGSAGIRAGPPLGFVPAVGQGVTGEVGHGGQRQLIKVKVVKSKKSVARNRPSLKC